MCELLSLVPVRTKSCEWEYSVSVCLCLCDVAYSRGPKWDLCTGNKCLAASLLLFLS